MSFILEFMVGLVMVNVVINHLTGFNLLGGIWTALKKFFSLPFHFALRCIAGLVLAIALILPIYKNISGLKSLIVLGIGFIVGWFLVPLFFSLLRKVVKGWKFVLWLLVVLFLVACGYVGYVL